MRSWTSARSSTSESIELTYDLVAIGCSWGGLRALGLVLGSLPTDLSAAIVIAQHRSTGSPRDALAAVLASTTSLPVAEVEDKDVIEPGHVYVAPADYHLLVEPGYFSLSTDELVQYARPSIDVLLESAADSYADRLIAMILTGANEDGATGVRRVKQSGGFVIAQHPDSAEKPTMPRAAIDTGVVDEVLALGDLGPRLLELCTSVTSKGRAP